MMSRYSNMRWSGPGALILVSALLSACGTTSSAPVKQPHDQIVDQPSKVQSLQRQLRERDRRIEELEAQLEALKLIDKDYANQKKLLPPPPLQ